MLLGNTQPLEVSLPQIVTPVSKSVNNGQTRLYQDTAKGPSQQFGVFFRPGSLGFAIS